MFVELSKSLPLVGVSPYALVVDLLRSETDMSLEGSKSRHAKALLVGRRVEYQLVHRPFFLTRLPFEGSKDLLV